MAEFTVRSDSVNVEQIMEQIRSRIREKRDVDYSEAQIRELATVKLEKFLDSRGIRSSLLEEFRRARPPLDASEFPNYSFEDQTLFESHRAPIRWIRRLLLPLLKLFFNPNRLIAALNVQAKLNDRVIRHAVTRYELDHLYFELLHNLVLETTRMGIELRNMQMRLESISSRLEFNERRARALESVVAYRPLVETAEEPRVEVPMSGEPAVHTQGPGRPQEGPGQRSRRRRRRRGRRSGTPAATVMGEPAPEGTAAAPEPGVDPSAAHPRQGPPDVGRPDQEASAAPSEGAPPPSPTSEQ